MNKERSSANFTARCWKARTEEAFQDVFGNFKDIEQGLLSYARKFTFNSYVLQNPPQINEKDFSSRLMSVGETEAELGAYRLFPMILKKRAPRSNKPFTKIPR